VLAALTALGTFSGDRDPEPAYAVIEARGGVDLSDLRDLGRKLGRITAAAFQRQGLVGKMLGDAIARARADLIAQSQASAGRG